MYGLAEIVSINEHAALVAEDAARRKLGLKPASTVAKIARQVRAAKPLKFAKPASRPYDVTCYDPHGYDLKA